MTGVAVRPEGLVKRFGDVVALDGFDMTVPTGSMGGIDVARRNLLKTLHTAWQAACTVATRSPTAGIEWHTQFGHTRRRLIDWIIAVAGECSHGRTHSPSRPAPARDDELLVRTIDQD